jgi:hypothetical protein
LFILFFIRRIGPFLGLGRCALVIEHRMQAKVVLFFVFFLGPGYFVPAVTAAMSQ